MADGPGALSPKGRGEGRRAGAPLLRVWGRAAARPFVNPGADVPVPGRGAFAHAAVYQRVFADDAYAESFFVSIVI